MKGQIQFTNLMVLFFTAVTYMIMLPLLQIIIDQTANILNGTTPIGDQVLVPNAQTQLIIMLLYLMPAVILFGIILTVFNYAIPQREGYG